MIRQALIFGAGGGGALLLLLLLAGCAVPQARTASLPPAVMTKLAMAGIPNTAVGAIVVRVADGQTLLSHQPTASLQPASTLKTLTAIVGLETLGPTYRTSVELSSGGAIADGVLQGELRLKGMGNPDFDWQAFQRMLLSLRQRGIGEINGDLLLDRQWYQPSRPDLDVTPFDETPEFRYNVVPDALMLNSNLLALDFEASGEGGDARLRVGMMPALEGVSVVSKMTFVKRACKDWEEGWLLPTVTRNISGGIVIELHGVFPLKCSASTEINVLDRVEFADRLFRALWRSMGGTFSGQTRDSAVGDVIPANARVLAKHQSRSLAEITRNVNKRSDNPITRMVYLNIGAASATDTALPTAARAERRVRAWLQQQGIDDTGLVLENGSGLSRSERVTPAQLAAVLRVAVGSKWAPEFLTSLPIVGVDGGMEKRLVKSRAAGWARIKTGSLFNVAAVAGFVPNAANEMCIVVMMINSPLVKDGVGKGILDALLEAVAESKL